MKNIIKLLIVVNIILTLSLFSQTIKVDDFGAVGDGVTDDRAAIQSALDKLKSDGGELQFTSGKTYIIGRGLNLLHTSDTKNYLITSTDSEKATIKNKDETPIEWGGWGLRLYESYNVTLSNIRLDGNRETRNPHEEKSGNYLIQVERRCNGLRLYDVHLTNSVMDDLFFEVENTDTTTFTTDFEMYDCLLDNSYRNNMSVIRGKNFKIIGCEFNNAYGHDPESGIDFEPNRGGVPLGYSNMLIEGCSFKENKRYGIMFTEKGTKSGNCTVKNCYFENNGLQIASRNNTIKNNIFIKMDHASDYGGPVDGILNIIGGDSQSNKIHNNYFYDNQQSNNVSRNLIAFLRRALGFNEVKNTYSYNNSARGIVYDYSGNNSNISNSVKLKNKEMGYWNMDSDSISENSIFDLSDFGQTGTLFNNPVSVSGKINEALDFSGGNKYIKIPVKQNLNIEMNITLSAWIKWNGASSDSEQVIVGRDKDWKFTINNSGQLGFYAPNKGELPYTAGWTRTDASIPQNSWVLATITYNGRETNIYIDSLGKACEKVYGKLDTSSTNITIGSLNDSTGSFNGYIDDVKIYNYALAKEEIKNLFMIPTSIEKVKETLPTTYLLEQNYPNPFNPTTEINFTIPTSGSTSLEIYNVLGQRVVTLVNKELQAGSHNYKFNANNLPTGIYIYRLQSKSFSAVKKMMLIK